MAQYAKIFVKANSDKAPDWGIGKGIIASQYIKLDDDEQVAAMQLIKAGERLMEENVHYGFEKISEEEWVSASPDVKSEQEILIDFFRMMYPNECEDGMGYSFDEEEMRGDRMWYKKHYGIPEEIEWVGQNIQGIGQWEGSVFLFDKNNKYIGIARKSYDKSKEYVFDPIELKYVIGPENYKKYYGKE